MAVETQGSPITKFDQWYEERGEDERTGALEYRDITQHAVMMKRQYLDYKSEMDSRVGNFYKLEMLADGQVISPKADLPNVSSGETAGIVRRIARNLVQHTPNVEVVCEYDDDSPHGIFAKFILDSKIIGDAQYSNDMQQNLFSSVKTAFTLGFDCVVPVLLQDAAKGWFIKYDVINHRDVYPEPGATDVRDAQEVFVRRYLTEGEVKSIIRNQVTGWDITALKLLAQNKPQNIDQASASHTDKKRKTIPKGYEIITWYSSSGDPFLTFCGRSHTLLRIEQNNHPLKWHPVHFLVLEKDAGQPLGKSQVELLVGRQEFQDLMLNGAMKLWYRNINPAIMGYGVVNAIPNLGPGKYNEIANPNAKVEAFEVNTGTLMQYGMITQQNMGSMVQLVGAADATMAVQANGSGMGMGQTPQGVEAQQAMVDITTNNYQKAIESFFSHYCSYALTIFFQELKGSPAITPTADARKKLINAGLDPALFDENTGELDLTMDSLAKEYFVRTIPGSLVELEDEKQMRILNELFIPLSQSMPALANAQDPTALQYAAAAMQFIITKEIELSGSSHSADLKALVKDGKTDPFIEHTQRVDAMETTMGDLINRDAEEREMTMTAMADLKAQMDIMAQTQAALLEKLGITNGPPAVEGDNPKKQ